MLSNAKLLSVLNGQFGFIICRYSKGSDVHFAACPLSCCHSWPLFRPGLAFAVKWSQMKQAATISCKSWFCGSPSMSS